ncbi:MAG: phosphodiesterase [Eubacteriales bacterium]
MKMMIASDIHGSAFYARKMLEAFEREKADRLLLLGDLLYHGPRNDLPCEYNPKEVIMLLNSYKDKIFAVRGNCDTEVDQMVLEFPILAEYCICEVGSRNPSIRNRIMYVAHGHNFNPSKLPPMHKGDILLNGHTHIPACIDYGEYLYLNPGSVSIPKENSLNSYMMLEEGIFTWKSLEGIIFDTCQLDVNIAI